MLSALFNCQKELVGPQPGLVVMAEYKRDKRFILSFSPLLCIVVVGAMALRAFSQILSTRYQNRKKIEEYARNTFLHHPTRVLCPGTA